MDLLIKRKTCTCLKLMLIISLPLSITLSDLKGSYFMNLLKYMNKWIWLKSMFRIQIYRIQIYICNIHPKTFIYINISRFLEANLVTSSVSICGIIIKQWTIQWTSLVQVLMLNHSWILKYGSSYHTSNTTLLAAKHILRTINGRTF